MTDQAFPLHKRWEFENIMKDLLGWVSQLVYWYGWQRGRASLPQTKSADGIISLWDDMPDFENIMFSWYRNQARYYLKIEDLPGRGLSNIMLGGKSLDSHLVFGQSQLGSLLQYQETLPFIIQVEETLKALFPGCRFKNSLRFCLAPTHLAYPGTKFSSIHNQPVFTFANQIGERWLCVECLERYGLEDENTPPTGANKKQQREFEKLNPALRLSIIERDGYTCTQCGRSPFKGDDIKLNVGHIQPVMDGGKTEPANLKTVCQRCK